MQTISSRPAKKIKGFQHKASLPTTTAAQSRCAIFAPTRGLAEILRGEKISTSWGTAWVERVTLLDDHRSVLATLLNSYQQHFTTGGTIVVLFHRYDLLKRLGRGDSSRDYLWLQKILDDLRSANFKIEDARGVTTTGILRKHRVGKVADARGVLYAVELEAEYVRFLSEDIPIFVSQRRLKRILALQADIVRSVAWYVTSHDHCTMTIAQVLREIGVPESIAERTRRLYVQKIREEADGLAALGVAITTTIEGDPRFDWHGDQHIT